MTQVVHPVGHTRKRELLSHLIKNGEWKQVLVFTAPSLGPTALRHSFRATGSTQPPSTATRARRRARALADFKSGAVRTLVATDIAARGLDIDSLPHVVNYDLPNVPEDYVHRIGRTGRAGESGCALSLVSAEEKGLLNDIHKVLGHKIPVEVITGFEQDAAAPAASTARPADQNHATPRKTSGFSRQPSRRR